MARQPIDGEMEGCPWGIIPEKGREYRVAFACCGGCQDADEVLEGHSACSFQADNMIDAGWREEARCLNGQWEAILSRKREVA